MANPNRNARRAARRAAQVAPAQPAPAPAAAAPVQPAPRAVINWWPAAAAIAVVAVVLGWIFHPTQPVPPAIVPSAIVSPVMAAPAANVIAPTPGVAQIPSPTPNVVATPQRTQPAYQQAGGVATHVAASGASAGRDPSVKYSGGTCRLSTGQPGLDGWLVSSGERRCFSF